MQLTIFCNYFPKIKATWLGDFAMNTHLANFDSKYLLTPDWRASKNISAARKSQQVQVLRYSTYHHNGIHNKLCMCECALGMGWRSAVNA